MESNKDIKVLNELVHRPKIQSRNYLQNKPKKKVPKVQKFTKSF
jgi:hypothetical protein